LATSAVSHAVEDEPAHTLSAAIGELGSGGNESPDRGTMTESRKVTTVLRESVAVKNPERYIQTIAASYLVHFGNKTREAN
jgi:proline dehydrogenase